MEKFRHDINTLNTLQILKNKYKPINIDQIIGQDITVKIIKNMIRKDCPYQTILITGEYGIGKTSLAHLIFKGLNCDNNENQIPCNMCKFCKIDITNNKDCFEIDGATYNGVDNIRYIIENTKYKPEFFTYKVFIIDEAHMLTTEAFNSLLKTIEYPPKYCIFILVTTNEDKIIPTVRSRCLHLRLNNIDKKILNTYCKKICNNEKILFDDKIINILSESSKGSVRNLLVNLEKLLLGQCKTIEDAIIILNIIPQQSIWKIYYLILSGKLNESLNVWINFKKLQCAPIYFLQGLYEIINYCIIKKNYTNDIDVYFVNIDDTKNIKNAYFFKHLDIITPLLALKTHNYFLIEVLLIKLSITVIKDEEEDFLKTLYNNKLL